MDAVALAALSVSFVALFISLVQVAHQHLVTASDYRRCSQRTIGKWATRANRPFHWGQLRFEVTFSTPRISCLPPSTDFEPEPSPHFNPDPENVPASNSEAPASKYEFFKARERRKAGCRLRATSYPSAERWYLDGKNADEEGKCSWLMLLEDTIDTDARFTIREMRNSYDFMPAGIAKPLASAEKKSFLTLMSLFGVKWKNRGRDRVIEGAGDFCEITVQSTASFKELFVYTSQRKVDSLGKPLNVRQKYYLVSERARKAMFHCFDLGFATFLTHSAAEIEESMKDPSLGLAQDAKDTVKAYYEGSNQWCPGLSESITCWAAQSMPKVVDKNTFKSMFSAISAISLTTGQYRFVRMLLGFDTDRCGADGHIKTLTGWARQYCEVHITDSAMKTLILSNLKYAADSEVYQNISDVNIPWDTSRKCLKCVRYLDNVLNDNLLRGFDDDPKRRLKVLFSNQQIEYGSNLHRDAAAAAKKWGSGLWVKEVDRVGADNYMKVARDITDKFKDDTTVAEDIRKKFRTEPTLAKMIVVNRLMRGALWVIHNGNAPNQAERVLECSLSSTWLSDTSTVYIT